MATISNGEGGLSVRNKLNEIINRVEGNATITNDVSFGDSNKLVFGAGSDLQIYHDGSNSYIADAGTGSLIIEGTDLNLRATDNSRYLVGVDGGSGYTALYHPNGDSLKLKTTSTGIDVTGSITTDKSLNINATTASTFGFIEMGGPSGAYIDMKAPASDDYDARIIYSGSGNALSIITLADEAILLKHGDTTRLATKNSGVDITGDLNASAKLVANSYIRAGNGSGGISLTHNDGYGNANITFNHEAGTPEQDGNAARIAVNTDASTDVSIAFQVGSGVTDGVATGLTQVATMYEGNINTTVPFRVTSGTETAPAYSFSGATAMGLYTTGGSLRAATGGQERLSISSAGKVGIGVSNATMKLDVDGGSLGTTANDRLDMLRLSTLSSNADRLDFTIERLSSGTTWTSAAHRIQRRVDAVEMGYIQFGANNDDLITFGEGVTERARIDGDGNVGIGITSPATKLDVAGTTTTDGLNLDAISETISDTGAALFVYDTRKDSDGGAWRKRTQNTSWYNESLNTSLRGSRKEFPSVAVIVADNATNYVTIYDGDDPDLPMWIKFPATTSDKLYADQMTSVKCFNGTLALGSNGSNGALSYANFISDSFAFHTSGFKYNLIANIAERNDNWNTGYTTDAGKGLVHREVNGVAVTAFPNAPIDPSTGLPALTIGVATDAGISIVKNDKSVIDVTTTTFFDSIEFDGIDMWATDLGFSDEIRYYENIPAKVQNFTHDFTYWGGSAASSNTGMPRPYWDGGSSIYDKIAVTDYGIAARQHDNGLFLLRPDHTHQNGLGAYVHTDFNTGWMHGDIRLSTLSTTDDSDPDGSELVTNGTFDTDVSNWVAGDAASGVSYDSGTLLLTNNDNSPAFVESSYFTTVVGKTYVFSFDVTARSNPSKQARILVVGQTAGTVIDSGSIYDVGSYSVTFTANDTSTQVLFSNGNQTASTGTFNFDNASVRIAEPDRTNNRNGFQIVTPDGTTFGRVKVATGADLAAFSGFTNEKYLKQPPNSQVEFDNTDEFSIMIWSRNDGTDYEQFYRLRDEDDSGGMMQLLITTSQYRFALHDGTAVKNLDSGTGVLVDDVWQCVVATYKDQILEMYVDGELVASETSSLSGNFYGSNSFGYIGVTQAFGNSASGTDMALLRISASVPSPEQVKYMYETEKLLFQENAACTLTNTQNRLQDVAFDSMTKLVHAVASGSGGGRTVLQGLRRVDSTTDASERVAASGGLVAED